MTKYQINLSSEELAKRASTKYMPIIKMLKANCEEYKNLKDGDKKALKHLINSARYLEKAYLRQDNEKNIEFRNYLVKEVEKGNTDAKNALKIFDAQRGINAIDRESNYVCLMKGQKVLAGKGFYPADLSEQEFHAILKNMINENKIDEVKQILSYRTMVIRNGKELKAIDYTEFFKDEFQAAAKELELASKYSTNKDFNEYLILQAKALKECNLDNDAQADKKWAQLQDTPLEYTITRENYEDELTGSVFENETLKELFKKHDIYPEAKDYLGVRVGIVNKKGTKMLLEIKKYLPILAQNMPRNSEYKQNISCDEDAKQTMVDVDLVEITGDVRSYRAGITLAENLPNDNKPSLQIGGGRRNVYHRQVRLGANPKKIQKRLNSILDESQHKFYNPEAAHWFTIGHENAHSLGPSENKAALGQYQNIIEENKADITAFSMLDILVKEKMYTKKQRDEIILTELVDSFLKTKPTMSQAHRVRTVIQLKYYFDEGAISLKNNKIFVDIEKVIPASQKMLEVLVDIQLSQDANKAKQYIEKYFVWTDEMEVIAKKLAKINKSLNGTVQSSLANKISKLKAY